MICIHGFQFIFQQRYLYFYDKIPFIGQKDHKVVVQFGRFNDEQKVWYEWSY